MRHWRSVCLLFLLPPVLRPAPAVKFAAAYPPTNDIKIDNLVPIPMRDGVTLYADVYRPVKDGKYPVLVSRTPYSSERRAT